MTKFKQGAWVVLVLLPLGVLILLRLHRQYVSEDKQLEQDAAIACEAPVLRRHVVLVLIDRMDLATARAIQYARTLSPDELRAVHFAVDPLESGDLEADWSRLGLSRLPLDIIECPDRRLARAALELAAQTTADGTTELTILLPRRGFAAGWRRLLHDRSADRIAAAVGQLPHVNATIVPFQLTRGRTGERGRRLIESAAARAVRTTRDFDRMEAELGAQAEGTTPIAEAAWRARVRVAGPGEVDPGAHPDADAQPRVHPGRRDRGPPARLPGAAQDPRDPAGGPPGGPGDGGGLGGPAGHLEPRLRADRRTRHRGGGPPQLRAPAVPSLPVVAWSLYRQAPSSGGRGRIGEPPPNPNHLIVINRSTTGHRPLTGPGTG